MLMVCKSFVIQQKFQRNRFLIKQTIRKYCLKKKSVRTIPAKSKSTKMRKASSVSNEMGFDETVEVRQWPPKTNAKVLGNTQTEALPYF